MASDRQESALSEVIGFILILGVIALLLSIYVVYVVPAEGRQNEIYHMNELSSEFNEYQMMIDNLILNDQVGSTIYNTFTLSTQGITSSTGGFITFPLFQPAGSTGAILINQRVDNLEINALTLDQAHGPGDQAPNLEVITSEPQHIYTNFTLLGSYPVSGTNVSYIPQNAGILVVPLTNSYWKLWVNHTPRIDHVSPSQWNYNTDLTISVEKNGVPTIQELTIIKNIQNNTRYYVDIIDEAYGINADLQYPLYLQRIPISPYVQVELLNSSYGTNSGMYNENNTLGAVEYRSGNNYFIQQNYYYQMGGIFLKQDDGMVNKIPPAISISKGINDITLVKIDEVIITGSGIIGGTTPVQVQTQLYDVNISQMANGVPNAKWVAITVHTDPEAVPMWNSTFSRILVASYANGTVQSTSTSSTLVIEGYDLSNTTYDIELDIIKPYLKASVERIGIILE